MASRKISQERLNKTLARWQKRLRLQDWTIKAMFADEEFMKNMKIDPNEPPGLKYGFVVLDASLSKGTIYLLDPQEITRLGLEEDWEETLVHELIHCLYEGADTTAKNLDAIEKGHNKLAAVLCSAYSR